MMEFVKQCAVDQYSDLPEIELPLPGATYIAYVRERQAHYQYDPERKIWILCEEEA